MCKLAVPAHHFQGIHAQIYFLVTGSVDHKLLFAWGVTSGFYAESKAQNLYSRKWTFQS